MTVSFDATMLASLGPGGDARAAIAALTGGSVALGGVTSPIRGPGEPPAEDAGRAREWA